MTAIDDLKDRFEAKRIEGEKEIRERWRFLKASTKHAMVRSGFYSEGGQRMRGDPFSTYDPRADIELLENSLGTLKQCVSAKIPIRSNKGDPIPFEVQTDDVLDACKELLSVPAWHDPDFLRLALGALAAHQEANALWMVRLSREVMPLPLVLVAVGGLLRLGLVLLIPAALAFGLVAAMRHDVLSAGVAFYVLGAGALAGMSAKVQAKGKTVSVFERDYVGWSQFRQQRGGVVVGSGARFNLERLAQDGVTVPAVAFDLCAMLEAQTLAAATGAPVGSPPNA